MISEKRRRGPEASAAAAALRRSTAAGCGAPMGPLELRPKSGPRALFQVERP